MNNLYTPEDFKRKKIRHKPKFLFPVLLVIVILAIVTAAITFSDVFVKLIESDTINNSEQNRQTSDFDNIAGINNNSSSEFPTYADIYAPNKISGIWLVPGVDFLSSQNDTYETAKASIDTIMEKCLEYNFNTLIVPVNYNDGVIFNSDKLKNTTGGNLLDYIIEKAHIAGKVVYPVIDLNSTAGKDADLSKPETIEIIKNEIVALNNSNPDGLLIDGYYYNDGAVPYSEYIVSGGGTGYNTYRRDKLTSAIKEIRSSAKQVNSNLYFGLICDPVWAKISSAENGLETDETVFESLTDGDADTLKWINEGLFDWVIINNHFDTSNTKISFKEIADWWVQNVEENAEICFSHAANKIQQKSDGFKNPDELVKQLMVLKDKLNIGSVFYSFDSFSNDNTGSTAAVVKYLTGVLGDDYILKDLTINTPSKNNFTTYESNISFIGASDPQFPLTLNSETIERTKQGYFSIDRSLKIGINRFVFEHKGTIKEYLINYKKIIIKDIAPSVDQVVDGGSTIVVKATARASSVVTASLNRKTITLREQTVQDENGNDVGDFHDYTGIFTVPSGYITDTSIGTVKFAAKYEGLSESKTGGKITVRASKKPETELPDFDGVPGRNNDYIDVGKKLIAEVVQYQIETFDGNIIDDYSRPTNNYLPLGTLDYCSESTITDTATQNKYRLLGYGKRVYENTTRLGDNIRTYEGTLPDTNQISINNVKQDKRFTYITIDTAWKAPFKLDQQPQNYSNPYPKNNARPKYEVTDLNYKYIDITFCYSDKIEGNVKFENNNPIFSKAEWIKNKRDYTLRLYLNKTGGMYGWNAEYNSNDQLVFSFLHPAKIKVADNEFGYSLEGVRIVLDPGHGGRDPGAVGSLPQFTEAILNTKLSLMVRDKLKALGAEVHMTRETESDLELDPRVKKIKQVKPDLFISFHRNGANSSSASGYDNFYFTPFSKPLAQAIYDTNVPLYTNQRGCNWSPFYVLRVSDCPTVLTENGFMTNASEYSKLITDSFNNTVADATVAGIINYLKAIQ